MDTEFRELSVRESKLLEKLVEAAIHGRVELKTQLSHVMGKQIQDDGTLRLQCDGGTGTPGKFAPVAEGSYKDADGADVAVILHLGKGGFMSMLEIVRYDGLPIIAPPSAEELILLMPENSGQKPAEATGESR